MIQNGRTGMAYPQYPWRYCRSGCESCSLPTVGEMMQTKEWMNCKKPSPSKRLTKGPPVGQGKKSPLLLSAPENILPTAPASMLYSVDLLLPLSMFGPFLWAFCPRLRAATLHSEIWPPSMLTSLSSWIPSELAKIWYLWCHMHSPLSLLHADSKTSQCLLRTGNTAVTSGCKANTASSEPSCDRVTVIFASCPGLSIPNLRPLEGLWLHMAWIQCLGMSFVLPARCRFLWGPLQIDSARLLMTMKRGEAVFCAARVVGREWFRWLEQYTATTMQTRVFRESYLLSLAVFNLDSWDSWLTFI